MADSVARHRFNWRAAGVILTALVTVASLVWYQSSHQAVTNYGMTKATEHRARLDKTGDKLTDRVERLERTDASINQKLTRIETQQAHTSDLLQSMNKKLDKVIERRSP